MNTAIDVLRFGDPDGSRGCTRTLVHSTTQKNRMYQEEMPGYVLVDEITRKQLHALSLVSKRTKAGKKRTHFYQIT